MFIHPGVPTAEKVSKLAPGEFGAVFLWVTFDKLEDIPSAIAERISVKIGDYPEALSVITPPTSVNKNPVVVISSPLVGEDWVAANGPSNTSAHRRALIPINGHAYISQRFAIDWVQVYPDGKTYKGDPSDNKNYRAYGTEIHAVADGVVTQVGDGIPQNTPGAKSLAVPITLETIGGNHVIMEIGNGLVRVLRAYAAGLAARESWRQSHARPGAGAARQHRKFFGAASAFPNLQRQFGIRVGGFALRVRIIRSAGKSRRRQAVHVPGRSREARNGNSHRRRNRALSGQRKIEERKEKMESRVRRSASPRGRAPPQDHTGVYVILAIRTSRAAE